VPARGKAAKRRCRAAARLLVSAVVVQSCTHRPGQRFDPALRATRIACTLRAVWSVRYGLLNIAVEPDGDSFTTGDVWSRSAGRPVRSSRNASAIYRITAVGLRLFPRLAYRPGPLILIVVADRIAPSKTLLGGDRHAFSRSSLSYPLCIDLPFPVLAEPAWGQAT
jgi:hypothetical protein